MSKFFLLIKKTGLFIVNKRQRFLQIIIINLLFLCCFCSVAGFILNKTLLQKNGKINAAEYQPYLVSKQDLIGQISSTGQVVNNDKVIHSFSVPGTISDVQVKSGDKVKIGDVLAKLDTTTANDELATITTSISELNSEIYLAQKAISKDPLEKKQLENELSIAETNYNQIIQERNYLQTKSTASGTVFKVNIITNTLIAAGASNSKISESEYETAQIVVVDALSYPLMIADPTYIPASQSNIYSRLAGMVSSVSVSPGDAVSVDQLLFTLDGTQLELNILTAENMRLAAQKSLNDFNNGTGSQSSIDALKKQLKELQKEQQKKIVQIEAMTLTASIAGDVGQNDYQKGMQISLEVTATGLQKGVSISANNSLVIKAYVSDRQLTFLKKDQNANISIDSLNNKTYTGKVISISSQAVSYDELSGSTQFNQQISSNLTNMYKVIISFDQIDDLVRIDQQANISIETFTLKDVLVIPLSAIKFIPNENKLQIQKKLSSGEIEMVDVEIGLFNDENVEITSGINEGDTILMLTTNPKSISNNTGF
ncbi:MAG: biotin/lipoyl-binding protein [bacterium]